MLTYFSSVIHTQCTGGINGSVYMLQPTRIHVSKGNMPALHYIFNWMQVSCSGGLRALSDVVQNPVGYLLALGAARQLGVQLLEYEVHHTAFRLQTSLLQTEQMVGIASDLGSFLSEIQDAVVGNIARSFTTGRLPDVKRYLGVATTFEKFHRDVAGALQALKECNWHPQAAEAEAAWLRKEELVVAPRQAVPPTGGVRMKQTPVTVPVPFMQQGFPTSPMPTVFPPPSQSVLLYCLAASFKVSPMASNAYMSGYSYHLSRAPVQTRVDGKSINSNDLGHHSHHIHHHEQFHPRPKTHLCPHNRHERCHALTCNQKTVSHSDLVTRAHASNPPMTNYRQPSSAIDTPRLELPQPDETLRDRQSLDGGHYLHSFQDPNGQMRYVSKGPGFRFETYGVAAENMLKYGCGCWLDGPARRHFRDDGTPVGSSARYTCDSCIQLGDRYLRCY